MIWAFFCSETNTCCHITRYETRVGDLFFPRSKKKFDHFNAAFSCSIHPFYIYSYIISCSSFWGFSWCANCWRSLVTIISGFLSKSQRGNMNNWLHTWVDVGFNKPEYMMYPQFGGDGCLQLRWQLFFCMSTCDIFSLGKWFLTFFVHTDFYSFIAGKNAEFDLRISWKLWVGFSSNLDKECITSRWKSLEIFI